MIIIRRITAIAGLSRIFSISLRLSLCWSRAIRQACSLLKHSGMYEQLESEIGLYMVSMGTSLFRFRIERISRPLKENDILDQSGLRRHQRSYEA